MRPALFLLGLAFAAQAQAPLKVLFWGGPGGGAHNPTALSDTLAPFFGGNSVLMTYRSAASPVWLHPDTLAQYDVMLVYTTNQVGNDLTTAQLTNLYNWVDSGHVIVALHGATNTFLNGTNTFRSTTTTAGWRQLLGAQFQGHGPASGNGNGGTVALTTLGQAHASLTGTTMLATSAANTGGAPYWDEGRQHTQFVNDTIVLARSTYTSPAAVIPWVWVRPQGKGFVYYNASGHDGQVWKQAEFKGQVLRALRWGAQVGKPTALRGRAAVDELIRMQGSQLIVPLSEAHSVRVQDLSGRNVFRKQGSVQGRYDLSGLPLGYYSIQVLTRTDAFRALYVQNVQTR